MNSSETENSEHRFLVGVSQSKIAIVDLTLMEQQQLIDILSDRRPRTFTYFLTMMFTELGNEGEIWMIDSHLRHDDLFERYYSEPTKFKTNLRATGELMWSRSVKNTEGNLIC